MSLNNIKEPFLHKKINLDDIKTDQKSTANKPFLAIKRIGSFLIQEKIKLSLVILMVVFSSALSLLGPFLIGITIDDFISTKETSGLIMLLVFLGLVYLGHSISVFLQNFWMVGIAQNTVYDLRESLFEHFHELPISYFDENLHGELMSRVTNDIDNINNTLNQSVIEIFTSVLTLAGTLAVMLYLSPLLTLITMSIIPLMILAMRWITSRTGPLYKLQQQRLGIVNGYVEESISGQHVIKTFSQEERVIREFQERNRSLNHASFWAMLFSGFIPKVMNLLNFLSFGLIALFGGILAIKGHITVGVIVIFTEYARQFTRPLNELSNQFNILLSAIAGAERVFDVLDTPKETQDEQNSKQLPEIKGHFKFENVTFSYEDTETLKNLTFSVSPGETIAFVGHTGAGKSTIFNLILRFYNYQSGSITLDGNELKSIQRANLRSHMAFVLQDSFLFRGTIKDNIRYGRLNATDDEVIKAAKQANAHEFIIHLEQGYNTVLDDSGSGISQGQKQLLTIARAFIAEPTILLLDEATSNIDTITEIKISEALHTLMKNSTSFVIAHRLNTIKNADKIIYLSHGEIIEIGSHDELMSLQGEYYRLYANPS